VAVVTFGPTTRGRTWSFVLPVAQDESSVESTTQTVMEREKLRID